MKWDPKWFVWLLEDDERTKRKEKKSEEES